MGVTSYSLREGGVLRKYCSSSFRISGSMDFRARLWFKIRRRKTVWAEGEKRARVPCGIYDYDMMGVGVGCQRSQSGNIISSS